MIRIGLKRFCNKINVITTPIFYVNANPHIGHLYTAILADAVKHVYTLQGKKVFLSTGTDEHGLKIQQKAKENNTDVKTFCDKNSAKFKALFDLAGIKYDDYIRTTEERHKEEVHKIWKILENDKKVEKGTYSGYYSISDESFIPEKDLIQVDGKYVTKLKQPVEYITEENYKILFDKYINKYNELIEKNILVFFPSYIHNEVKEYINQKLFDICISRPKKRVTWGIDVPNDNEHVIYVWFEALINYLTVTNKHKPEDINFIHIIGKDISKFHCYIWPIMLIMSNKFPNKMNILMHNYWLMNQNKMSKSLGNIVDPFKLIAKHEIDAVRFYFLSNGPLNHDVNFDDKNISKVYFNHIPDKLSKYFLI
jgi:methionyl-tRNA synthetase